MELRLIYPLSEHFVNEHLQSREQLVLLYIGFEIISFDDSFVRSKLYTVQMLTNIR